jgi:hypothetical protein
MRDIAMFWGGFRQKSCRHCLPEKTVVSYETTKWISGLFWRNIKSDIQERMIPHGDHPFFVIPHVFSDILFHRNISPGGMSS